MSGEAQIPPPGILPVTVFVIAQDEEAHIADCLASAAFAAERVVLDGGSRDRTRELAAAAGARVEQRPFDGMNAQKNAALDLCRQPWVLNLDADERVGEELRRELEALFAAGEPPCAGYTMPRRAFHLGRWIRGGGWYPDRKLRLFRRTAGRFAGRDPHDKVVVDGPVGRLGGDLLHYAYRDLAHHVAKLDGYTTAAAPPCRGCCPLRRCASSRPTSCARASATAAPAWSWPGWRPATSGTATASCGGCVAARSPPEGC